MPPQTPEPLDDARMTIGEHLDELRGRVIRSLAALVIASLVMIYPARYLLEIIVRPAQLALRAHAAPETFLQTAPTELMIIYIKVIIYAGVLLALPYIAYQIWGFVAAGLYRHERQWVLRLIAPSVGLFFLGVAFLYSVVLLVSLNFLVGLGDWIPLPDPKPTALEQVLLGQDEQAPALDPNLLAHAPQPPLLNRDPNDPNTGALWFNVPERRLKLRGENRTYVLNMTPQEDRPIVTTHFKIGEYLTFVITLSLAFGLAFQTPLIVLALVHTGILTPAQLRAGRRYVVLLVLVISGILAPPEFISHLLLAIPMLLLFEIGVWLAGRTSKPRRS